MIHFIWPWLFLLLPLPVLLKRWLPAPSSLAGAIRLPFCEDKRVFDLVKDFGTSESPKSTRSSTTHWCPGRPGHPAFRHNIASSLRLHTGLPYDWTPRSDAPLGSPLAPSARRVSRVASRLPGTTRLRFALHGGQRLLELQRSGPGLSRAGSRLTWLIWLLLVTAVARPVWIGADQPRLASGRDLMLLLDVSGSMRQMDFAREGEMLDRLDLVKQSALRFVEGREGDRIGLILFGAKPYLRAPPT